MREGTDFKPVSWDKALSFLAESMLRIREESGPAAILNYRSGGSLGIMKHVTDYFFEKYGPVTVKSGDICSGAGDAAQMEDFGEEDSHDLFDLLNSRTIVLWGKNPYVSSVHLLPVLREAKAKGARLVQIDPVHHRGCDLCDVYLQPRPGGDIALGLGLLRWMFTRGRVDPGASDYCDNLEALEQICHSRRVAEWADLAGVTVTGIERLAEAYLDGPSALLVGWGLQRRANGSAAVRVLDAIGALAGYIGVPGGGVSFYFKRRGAFDFSFAQGRQAAPRAIPEALLGRGILEADNPPIRMVWVHIGNPVAMLPESATVARALESRELTVVVDSFLTDTARCAHLVLPTTTMLEDEDLVGAYGHHWLGNIRGPLGLAEEFGEDARTWKRRLLGRVADRGASLEALERGAVRNPLAPQVLFADRQFPTATGKINLIHEINPEPPRPTKKRPLLLMALATEKAQSSQWPSRLQAGPAAVTIHPDAANGFEEGQIAHLESEIGKLEVRIRLDDRQRRDVALIDKGGWYHRGRCANALVEARETDAGGGAAYYDTPVRLIP
jgi:anaerobic selenocysteine-containing dehydrogenase